MPQEQKELIATYYDQTLKLYERFWHKKTYGVHYGFWDDSTKNLEQALINENQFMADLLGLSKGMKVLDAGCGVGGSSVWLAKNYGVEVKGISLSNRQVKKAKVIAKQAGVSHLTSFEVNDYLKTNYSARSFDIVWAEESVCYAENKQDFLKEAYRLLKPAGKLVVADGFLLRNVRDNEKKDFNTFLEGLALSNLASVDSFKKNMQTAGFKKVKMHDATKAVEPSSALMYKRVRKFYPLAWFQHKIGLISSVLLNNQKAGLAQYRLVKKGIAGYAVFTGEK